MATSYHMKVGVGGAMVPFDRNTPSPIALPSLLARPNKPNPNFWSQFFVRKASETINTPPPNPFNPPFGPPYIMAWNELVPHKFSRA